MRFYEPALSQSALNTDYALTQENAHHFARVLRGRVGDEVTLFNGVSGEFLATVLQVSKQAVCVRIQAFSPENRSPSVPLTLVVGVCHKQKLALIIEKAVELGVSHIYPVITERSQAQYHKAFDDTLMRRLQKIIIAAATQSGVNQLPKLSQPMHLIDLPWHHWQSGQCYFCHPGGQSMVDGLNDTRRVMMIGPEGGWSEQEIAWLIQQGCQRLRLAASVLRMETAAIVALAQAQ